ncbi:MAG: YHS domain-containing protein [Candidatus Omnitrophota bacterium]
MVTLRKSWWLVVLAVGILVSFASAADKTEMGHNHQMTAAAEGQVICPVLGQKASKAISYQYKGKTYYFCCAACVNDLKKNPEKYLDRIKEFQVSAKKYAFNPAEIKVK